MQAINASNLTRFVTLVTKRAVVTKRAATGASVRVRFDSPFSSKVVVSGYCIVTLSLTINEH